MALALEEQSAVHTEARGGAVTSLCRAEKQRRAVSFGTGLDQKGGYTSEPEGSGPVRLVPLPKGSVIG